MCGLIMENRGSLTSLYNHPLVQQLSLLALPVLAIIAYATQEFEMLFWAAIGWPLVLLAGQIKSNRRTMSRRPSGLRGQKGLLAQISSELNDAEASQRMACILLELDDPQELTQEWGMATTEMVHEEMVARVAAMMRKTDTVFALGRGKIGVVASEIRLPELNAVISLIQRLQDGISHPIALDDAEIHITASAGFCMDSRAPHRTAEALLDASNRALSEAKQTGNGSVRAYSNLTPSQDYDNGTLENEVLDALQSGEILPWFQPQISTDTGQITGFEALARWQHPEHGLIPPSEFIPLLERAGRMEDLSETILNQALKALVEWDKNGLEVPTVSVNFATQELRNPSLVERIKWDVDRYDLEPRRLTVEILETVIADYEDDVITRNIRELGSQGFNIDLDDFGTGHATLSNIRRFKVDRIKIDRSFVTRADEDPEQQRMVSAIVGMAERLEIDTLAEGVETIGEQSILSQLGCTHLQGFGIARPMPFDETLNWLAEHQEKLASPILFNRKIG